MIFWNPDRKFRVLWCMDQLMKNLFKSFPGLMAVWLLLAPAGWAQRTSAAIVQAAPAPLSKAEAAKFLDDFSHSFVPGGDFCLRFDLTHYLRRSDVETHYAGVAWCTWGGQGAVARFRVVATPADKSAKPVAWEWLLINGPKPQVWVLGPGDTAAHELPPEKWREPLFAGLIYTPFDLLMPFLYWPNTYDGAQRTAMGSGVDLYTMKAPEAEKANGVAAVKLTIVRDPPALQRAEQLDGKGALVRRFDLNEFAQVQDEWMIKSADLMNLVTRDYDRFTVMRAAMKLKLAPAIFDPAKLATPAPEPPAAAWAGM